MKVGQKFQVHHVVDEIKDADGRLLDKVIEQTGRARSDAGAGELGRLQAGERQGRGQRHRQVAPAPAGHIARRPRHGGGRRFLYGRAIIPRFLVFPRSCA